METLLTGMSDEDLLNDLARCTTSGENVSPAINEITARVLKHSAMREPTCQAKIKEFATLALKMWQEDSDLSSQSMRVRQLGIECSMARKELLVHMRA